MTFTSAQQHWLEFLLAMTEKEIKARYKFALLGFLWIVLNPLLQMLVIGVIFQFFVPIKVDNYFLFLFAGLLPWNFFAISLAKATPSIVHERALIEKAKFPRESIVLSIILANLFHLVISLLLLVIIIIGLSILGEINAFSISEIPVKIAVMMAALLWMLVLTTSLSLFFSALNVRFRDVNFLVQAVIPLWFYATPIIYTLDLLPSYLHFVAYLNPMTAIIELFHWTLLDFEPISFSYWWVSLGISIVCLVAGIWCFKRESPNFDDWI